VAQEAIHPVDLEETHPIEVLEEIHPEALEETPPEEVLQAEEAEEVAILAETHLTTVMTILKTIQTTTMITTTLIPVVEEFYHPEDVAVRTHLIVLMHLSIPEMDLVIRTSSRITQITEEPSPLMSLATIPMRDTTSFP
jgi:undecaprenyl pyrophosphate synthase